MEELRNVVVSGSADAGYGCCILRELTGVRDELVCENAGPVRSLVLTTFSSLLRRSIISVDASSSERVVGRLAIGALEGGGILGLRP